MAKKKTPPAPLLSDLTMDQYDRITLELCHVESLVKLLYDHAHPGKDEDAIEQSLVTFLSERVDKIREVLSAATSS